MTKNMFGEITLGHSSIVLLSVESTGHQLGTSLVWEVSGKRTMNNYF